MLQSHISTDVTFDFVIRAFFIDWETLAFCLWVVLEDLKFNLLLSPPPKGRVLSSLAERYKEIYFIRF
jgi:hypothetical protein